MKKNILIVSLFFMLASLLPAGWAPHFDGKESFKSQETIIAELSGAKKLENGQLIVDRSTPDTRALAREYLSRLINGIGFEANTQKYSLLNVNPLVDILFNPFKGGNVFATLPATNDSEEYVILGAHFDTELYCPGAIDNGTGIALVYEVFYELSKLEQRNKNVIIVFFDQEEEDLIGSQAFAKYLLANDFIVHSVHTFDSIGWDEDGDRAIELELPTPYIEKVYRKNADLLGVPIHISPGNSTDHNSFRVTGFNAVGITDEYYNGDYSPYKDTPDDKFNTVHFEYLKSCTKLVGNTIKEIIK